MSGFLAILAIILVSLQAAERPATPVRWFAADSFWNTPLAKDAPKAPTSAEHVAFLVAQTKFTKTSSPLRGRWDPGENVHLSQSIAVWTVRPDQATAKVVLTTDKHDALREPGYEYNLQSYLLRLPIPTGIARLGTLKAENEFVVYQPSTGRTWEFRMFTQGLAPDGPNRFGQYEAAEAGYVANISKANGIYPGAPSGEDRGWGVKPSGFAQPAGVIMMAEFLAGCIKHKLGFCIASSTATHVAPATGNRGAMSRIAPGQADPLRFALPVGTTFRLPPGFDCTPPPGADPLYRMICEAARDYGIVITANASSVHFFIESDMTVGTSYQVVKTSPWKAINLKGIHNSAYLFPWSSLEELLPCTGRGCAPDPTPSP